MTFFSLSFFFLYIQLKIPIISVSFVSPLRCIADVQSQGAYWIWQSGMINAFHLFTSSLSENMAGKQARLQFQSWKTGFLNPLCGSFMSFKKRQAFQACMQKRPLWRSLHMNGFNDMEGKKVFDEVSHFDFLVQLETLVRVSCVELMYGGWYVILIT